MNTRSTGSIGPAIIVAALVSGCAIPTRVASVSTDIPRDLTPVAIDAGLKAMDDQATKQRIAHMLASPEMKDVERELVAGVVDGSLAALGDQKRVAAIGALSSRYLQATVQPMVKGFSGGDVSGAVSGAISRSITDDLGPAVQKVLADNLAPGLAAALGDDRVQEALGKTAHMLGREMVLGANEGLAHIKDIKPAGEKSTLGELASKGVTLATSLTWLLAAIVVALGAWIAKLLLTARRERRAGERRGAPTRHLAEAMKATEHKSWKDAHHLLRRRVAHRVRGHRHAHA